MTSRCPDGYRWFVGLVIGASTGVLALMGGLFGILFAAAAWIMLSIEAPRAAPVGGLCTGTSAAWLLLLLRASAACDAGCRSPDLGAWYLATVALLGFGIALTARWVATRDAV
jgi:hypothetical protein